MAEYAGDGIDKEWFVTVKDLATMLKAGTGIDYTYLWPDSSDWVWAQAAIDAACCHYSNINGCTWNQAWESLVYQPAAMHCWAELRVI
jgi:hypothetical protein